MKDVIVSFPGLGIGEFSLDSAAFSIGNFSVYWYGIIITCGIIFAFLYATFRGKYEKVSFDSCIDLAIWTVIPGVIGARLYYVLTTLEEYIPEPFNFIEFIKNVFNIRGGGLAIYGGIICGAIGLAASAAVKKINPIKVLDMAGPGVMIAQALGRWGNFFNGEAFGGIVSEGHPLYFMRMGLISHNSISDFGTAEMVYVHPTFLYESLWNLTGFILINIFYKKKRFNGQIACMYLSWYGFGRMFIEGLRTDSLYVGSFRISQVVGLLCFVIFGGLLIAGLINSRRLDSKAELNKFDKLLVPDIVDKPVFFNKKAEKEPVVKCVSSEDMKNTEQNEGESEAPKTDTKEHE